MSTETEPQAKPASALRIQTERVHSIRRNAEATAAALKAKREAFEQENTELLEILRETQRTLLEEELRLRDMALAEFKSSGDARPCAGVQIKHEIVTSYETAEAFAWAKKTDVALMLDSKAFDQIAKVTLLPFVKLDRVPKATIATDLGKALLQQ